MPKSQKAWKRRRRTSARPSKTTGKNRKRKIGLEKTTSVLLDYVRAGDPKGHHGLPLDGYICAQQGEPRGLRGPAAHGRQVLSALVRLFIARPPRFEHDGHDRLREG